MLFLKEDISSFRNPFGKGAPPLAAPRGVSVPPLLFKAPELFPRVAGFFAPRGPQRVLWGMVSRGGAF